ncbi:hypothetical protein DCAR_0518924 [Daucus carota subsp. sativus]|uniref:Uncharacterized protein n=1 Tax=Daucus carota subsp. sativus TaxID=79200 RepID=A0A164XL44_DAUCS|nr:hypothetical protein DCAR_0518924 [Daucus carota subsp. sativus]
MDLDVRLGPHDGRFLDVPMHENEVEHPDQALEQGWGEPNGIGMTAEFMNNIEFYAAVAAPKVEIHDLVHEDELLDEDDAVVVLE